MLVPVSSTLSPSKAWAEQAVLFFAQNLAELTPKLVARVGLRDQIDATPELPPMYSGVLDITGGEQHGNSGNLLLRLAGQFRSPQGAGHPDVGEEQVDRGAAFDNYQSAVGIFRSQHTVAQFRQHFRCRHP